MSFGKIIRVFASLVILVAGAFALYVVYTGVPIPFIPDLSNSTNVPKQPEGPQEKSLANYSWTELSQISKEIAAAPTNDEARSVAQAYKLIDENNVLSDEEVQFELSDGSVVSAQLVGICHDDKADGSGKAGLTFVTKQALDQRAMNVGGDNAGGWEASEMRSWLASTELPKFPAELRSAIVPVKKATNNAGGARDASAVSTTDDELWLLSASEVCGKIDWFTHEYGNQYAYLDDVVNAEGTQYERYVHEGITPHLDPSGTLAKSFQEQKSAWWYRSAFFFVYEGLEHRYFYNVLPTGYPYGYSAPNESLGVVVGFCI
ncbi:DUF6273 domain-containing protein [Atopobium fossor]|uniref:DUF6273 domain-containing protein n=1 Tax=Atopobium fossor TaxID=39487 RepID=UPI0004274E21|nr:DUF6273 domain-containing protein [Atopobium fossor]